MINRARTILKDIFGYDNFRPLQTDIIHNILSGQDTLVIMPTGGGKSLCYQVPALIFEGITLVVSPLISLMADQVQQLELLGVQTGVLNSSVSAYEYQKNIDRLHQQEIKLLYLAPETLLMPRTLQLLSTQKIACITIDEAHCISEWGHDFRPEYRKIADIRQQFPQAVCVALTATATPRVQQDIKASLNFSDTNEFIASFNRTNLVLQIDNKSHATQQTLAFLQKNIGQSGIIYCFSRRQVTELTEAISAAGFSVKPYHAGLSNNIRQDNQAQFIRDDVQIMVATVAFGMGINKPNVRFVVHYDLPQNIESYYQQIGRAGRDGLPAHCLLLFSYADIQKIKFFINQKTDQEKRLANQHLNALVGLAETEVCRRIPLLQYFGEEYASGSCGACDNCLNPQQSLTDVTVLSQKFLSCVKRTGGYFGAGHIIDVLRGSRSQKVLNKRHDQLSTYGIGRDLSKQQWFYLSRQLIQKGLLEQNDNYGSLTLTATALPVLRNQEKVMAKLEIKSDKLVVSKSGEQQDYNQELFELLRQARKKLADQEDVPPYAIFPDKTIIEMAQFFPQSEVNFLQLHGVGAKKNDKYGCHFMQLIRDYCQENKLSEKIKCANSKKVVTKHANTVGADARHILIGKAYNEGISLTALCDEYKIKLNTTLNHLYKYSNDGYELIHGNPFLELSMLSAADKTLVLDKFYELGTEKLAPIFSALNKKISYDELHLLRLYCISNDYQTQFRLDNVSNVSNVNKAT